MAGTLYPAIFIADVVAIALMYRRRYRRRFLRLLQSSDTILHRLLHLLEGAHLDLAHALARDAEFGCQILERDRIVRQAARLEDALLAFVEHVERGDQRLVAVIAFLAVGQQALLAWRVVDQPVHPFAGLAIVADRRVERGIAAEPAVHIDHVALCNTEAFGDQL